MTTPFDLTGLQQWTGGDAALTVSAGEAAGALDPGEVRVWFLSPPADQERIALADFHPSTSLEERNEAQRFRFAADQWAYLAAQGLLRTVLAGYLRADPRELEFRRDNYGRRFLADPALGLFFSLAHSRGLVAVALSRERAIGVDTEPVGTTVDAGEVARGFFAPREVRHLGSLAASEKHVHFFVQWTVKESFLKAIGLGMHAAIDTLSVVPEGARLNTRFHRAFPEKRSGWAFWAAADVRGHHLAAAARSDHAPIWLRMQAARRFWTEV